jgi:hypothetical protein
VVFVPGPTGSRFRSYDVDPGDGKKKSSGVSKRSSDGGLGSKGAAGGKKRRGKGHQQILRMIVSKRLTDLGATLNACKTHVWPEREIWAPCTLSVGTLRVALYLALEQTILPLLLAGAWHIKIQVALFLREN